MPSDLSLAQVSRPPRAIPADLTKFIADIREAIVLGVTVNDTSVSGVPSYVYTTFICLECFGLLTAGLLLEPAKLRRTDGRAIASFKPLSWWKELKALGWTCLEPRMTLITLSIFSSEMYLSLTGAFNSWYFNARTRSLANVTCPLFSHTYNTDKGLLTTHASFCSSGTGSSRFSAPLPSPSSATRESSGPAANAPSRPGPLSASSSAARGSP